MKFLLAAFFQLELFAGAELNYKDIMYYTPYEVLLNVTPGAKLHFGDRTLLSAQAYVPIVNDWGDYYGRVRLSMFSLSHEFKLGQLALKPSAGLFSMERYGLDLKAMYPVNRHLALEAQLGYTGFLSMATGWEMSSPRHLLALAGADFWIPSEHIKLRLVGGRFLKDDYGCYAEAMRHFKRMTLGAYLQYSSNPLTDSKANGGFKIILALPPYRRASKSVAVRPASAFRFTNNMGADSRACKVYHTDPEENERHGWFSSAVFGWGGNVTDEFKEK